MKGMKKIKLENGENFIMKKVPNFEDLWVNVDGTVVVNKGKPLKIFELQLPQAKQKLLQVQFGQKKYYVHRLVAMAFHGLSDKRYVVHIDGVTTNNHYKNLTWATPREKFFNEVSNGTFANRRPICKIPVEDHSKVYERLKQGETLRKIALEYGVSDMSVHRIKARLMKEEAKQ